MLEPRIVAISVSRFAEAVAPAETGEAGAANDATLRLGLGFAVPLPWDWSSE
jgi:hypothetical protein